VPIRDPEYFPYALIPTPSRYPSEFFLESKPGLCPIDFSEGSTMDSGRYSYLKKLNPVAAIGNQPCADLRMLDVLDIQLYTSLYSN
jgi:hypothetical protein